MTAAISLHLYTLVWNLHVGQLIKDRQKERCIICWKQDLLFLKIRQHNDLLLFWDQWKACWCHTSPLGEQAPCWRHTFPQTAWASLALNPSALQISTEQQGLHIRRTFIYINLSTWAQKCVYVVLHTKTRALYITVRQKHYGCNIQRVYVCAWAEHLLFTLPTTYSQLG